MPLGGKTRVPQFAPSHLRVGERFVPRRAVLGFFLKSQRLVCETPAAWTGVRVFQRETMMQSHPDSGMQTGATAMPVLGLIFPPFGRDAPEEGLEMYGDQIRFVGTGLGLKTMTPDGYDSVLDRIVPAAEELAREGAEAIVLMGTSLSFYKGAAFNARLTDRLKEVLSLLAVTMSTGIVDALYAVGARYIVVATAYNSEVNVRLKTFLEESGFDVVSVEGLGLEKVEDVEAVTQPHLVDFGARVFAAAEGADAIL
ncbi:MAG TPA: hypothetical protein VKA19_09025, partial [Alphaproteobacteria bacterium]|nr:hypothetical protein [Alphaproteobacteria bacterium]